MSNLIFIFKVINFKELLMFLLHVAFFRIMMLSVLRHTKTPVKFWFLKNYLSPSFKVHRVSHAQASWFARMNLFPGANP